MTAHALIAPPRRKHACAIRGRHQYADAMLYSKHTGSRYCVELKSCRKRAERRNRSAS